MKILIISSEVWQDKTNGGNVLTNLFSDFKAEFAQIYCSPGSPENNICNKYYQMTDHSVIKSYFHKTPVGKSFLLSSFYTENNVPAVQPNKKFYSFFHKFRFSIFYFIKSIIWNFSEWKNPELMKFVLDFDPDIVFAPCYGSVFMLRLTRYIKNLCNKNIISYISDDSYSFNGFNLSIFYYINKILVRKELRKTFKYYSLVYTMTEEQKEQCERIFHANMKILKKSGKFDLNDRKEKINDPIRLVYAGGLYLNRWKTLASLADIIGIINKEKKFFTLDIYTGNEVPKKAIRILDNGEYSKIHDLVGSDELKEIYNNSDIALHVESFDCINSKKVKLSFSTKIIDCLDSGCMTMAICDEKQAGLAYIKRNDIGVCITKLSAIEKTLRDILKNKQIILDYQHKALLFAHGNLQKDTIIESLKNDFEDLLRN